MTYWFDRYRFSGLLTDREIDEAPISASALPANYFKACGFPFIACIKTTAELDVILDPYTSYEEFSKIVKSIDQVFFARNIRLPNYVIRPADHKMTIEYLGFGGGVLHIAFKHEQDFLLYQLAIA